MQHEIDRDGDQHPLLQNGFAGGTTVELLTTKKKIDDIYATEHPPDMGTIAPDAEEAMEPALSPMVQLSVAWVVSA